MSAASDDPELTDQLELLIRRWSPGLSRREFFRKTGITVGGLASAGPLLAMVQACGSTTTPASSAAAAGQVSLKGTGEVVYAGYGGIYQMGMQTAVFNHFTQDTGITVKVTADANTPTKIAAAVKVGQPQWDVIENPVVTRGVNLQLGILQKYDTSIVDSSGIADKAFVDEYGASFYSYAATLFWNTKAISTPMHSWVDVWNTSAFPGKRGFQNSSVRTFPEALMGDGVPIDKVFPLDTTRAINSLNKIKDSAVFQSLGTITNLAAQQDIVAGDLNLARTETLQKSNVPIDYTWNQAIVDSDSLGIIKGAQNVENANKLMAYTMLPQTQLRVLDALGYTPTATAALGILTVDQLKNLAGTSYTLPTSLILNGAYYSTHYTENEKLFQNWLLSLS